MKKCYQVHLSDNVAVLLQDAAFESIEIIGGTRSTVTERRPIGLGHEVAIAKIGAGAPMCLEMRAARLVCRELICETVLERAWMKMMGGYLVKRQWKTVCCFALLGLSAGAFAQQMKVVKPQESHEVLNNPGIGFTTFQRFNGDALNEGTIWPEGFPIQYDELKAKGSAKRAYPDASVAYFRIYWRFLEPEKGKYQWELIDRALRTAHDHGQRLMLRVAPYRNTDDSDVPAWYRVENNEPLPKNPASGGNSKQAKWAVDPEGPGYARDFSQLIRALGERYDGNPELELVDIALVGAWGEGAGSELLSDATRHTLVDAYTQSFRHTPMVGQLQDIRTTDYVMAQARTSIDDSSGKPTIGWRADCLGDMGGFSKTFAHMLDYYPEKILKLNLSDAWKTAPVSMESCWVMQSWEDRGWDIDYIFDKAIQWHVSSFNNKSSAVPADLWPKVNAWLNRMGYRFVLDRFAYSPSVDASRKLNFSALVTNKGNAPIYRPYVFALRVKNATSESVKETGARLQSWLPGDHLYEDAVFLPRELPDGKYQVEVAIIDHETRKPAVKLAIDGVDSDGWYPLGDLDVHMR